jgi:hypothetical protein
LITTKTKEEIMDKDLTIKLEELEYADILWVRCSAGMT